MDVDIPQDTRTVLKQMVVGVNQDVEFVYTLTAEQADELLLDLDQLRMDHDLTEDQHRLRQACLDRLASEPRPPEDRERAEQSVTDQHRERHEWIAFQRSRRG